MAEKHLEDHERAHTGKAGTRVRHGQDAIGKVGYSDLQRAQSGDTAGGVLPENRYHKLRGSLNKGLD